MIDGNTKIPAEITVDPNTAEKENECFVRTVKAAYERAVSLINAGHTDVVIHLSKGTHAFPEELLMDGASITAEEYSITWRGAENGETVLTSCYEFPAAHLKKEGTCYTCTLPEECKKNGLFPAFRDLYIDGRPVTLAASEGLYYTAVDSSKYAADNGLDQNDRLVYVAPSALGSIEVTEDGRVSEQLEFWLQIDWEIYALRVEAVYYDRKTPFTDKNGEALIPIRIVKEDWDAFNTRGCFKGYYYSTFANRRYWFQNNKAYLDRKNSFYYDRAHGKIYVKPTRPIDTCGVISFPRAEGLFHLKNIKNISFEHLTFTGTTVNYITENGYITSQAGDIRNHWTDPDTGEYGRVGFLPYGAIYGRDVKNLSVTDCRFTGVGGDGINVRGRVMGARVTGCSFEQVGGAAVRFADSRFYAYTEENQYNDIVIRNNFMKETGAIFNSHPAVVIGQVKNLDLSYNTILDSAYSAISVSWDWGKYKGTVNTENARIEYNYVENFMTKMQDGGAIYTLGGNAPETTAENAEYINSMSHNYVVMTEETGNGSGHFTVFYHDQGSSHWSDRQNILIASAKATHTDHTYNSFQSINPGVHNIKNDGFIFIGEWKEGRPYKEITNNPDGSRNYVDAALTDRANIYRNLYEYKSFEELAGTENGRYVTETAEKAGCDRYHPVKNAFSGKHEQ